MNFEKRIDFPGIGKTLPQSVIERDKLYKERDETLRRREESIIERLKKNPYGGKETSESQQR